MAVTVHPEDEFVDVFARLWTDVVMDLFHVPLRGHFVLKQAIQALAVASCNFHTHFFVTGERNVRFTATNSRTLLQQHHNV